VNENGHLDCAFNEPDCHQTRSHVRICAVMRREAFCENGGECSGSRAPARPAPDCAVPCSSLTWSLAERRVREWSCPSSWVEPFARGADADAVSSRWRWCCTLVLRFRSGAWRKVELVDHTAAL